MKPKFLISSDSSYEFLIVGVSYKDWAEFILALDKENIRANVGWVRFVTTTEEAMLVSFSCDTHRSRDYSVEYWTERCEVIEHKMSDDDIPY